MKTSKPRGSTTKKQSGLKKVLRVLGVLVALQLAGLLFVFLSLGANAEYWNQHNEEDSGELLYVALGDSAAQGVGALHPSQSYVGYIAQKIEQATGKTVKVVNLSKSGARLQQGIDVQLEQLKNYPNPDIITVELGANDIKPATEQEFRRDFTEFVRKLPAGTFVADMPDFVYGSALDKQRRFAKVAREIIAQESDLNFVPLDAATQANFNPLTDYAADYFHPNQNGYGVWAEAFWSVIEPELR